MLSSLPPWMWRIICMTLFFFLSNSGRPTPRVNFTNILWAQLHQFPCANNKFNLYFKHKSFTRNFCMKKPHVKCWWNWPLILSFHRLIADVIVEELGKLILWLATNLGYFYQQNKKMIYFKDHSFTTPLLAIFWQPPSTVVLNLFWLATLFLIK